MNKISNTDNNSNCVNRSETSSIDSDIYYVKSAGSKVSEVDSGILATRSNHSQGVSIRKTESRKSGVLPDKLSLTVTPARRKSQVEREIELSVTKMGAMSQLENTFKMTDLFKEQTLKLNKLQSENSNLQRQLTLLKLKLEESRNINKELMDKLRIESVKNAERQIEFEDQRTNEFVDKEMSPHSSYDLYLNDILSVRDQLLDQNKHLQVDLENANEEINVLKNRIIYLESMSNSKTSDEYSIDDSNVDSRSKKELLHIIRDSLGDKMIWMDYAINLTRRAVSKAPDLLNIDTNSLSDGEGETFCCKSEAVWASFSISLLQKVNKSCPSLFQNILESEDSMLKDFLKTKLT